MLNFALGQLFAIDLAIIPVVAKWLGTVGFPGAIAQLGLAYLWMFLVIFYVKPWNNKLSNSFYLYLLLGVLDFESNFFISEAFGLIPPLIVRFIMVLTLPFTALFGSIMEGKHMRPSSTQLMGMVVTLAGVVLAIASPETLANGRDRTQAAKGILFSTAGAILLALSGLSQNALMKDKAGQELEMITFMSISGVILAAIQLPLWELDRYKNLENPGSAALGVLVISFCIAVFYVFSIFYKRIYPRSLPFNLVTVNAYVFLADLIFFSNWPVAEPTLGLAAIFTVGGTLVYHMAEAEMTTIPEDQRPLLSQSPVDTN